MRRLAPAELNDPRVWRDQIGRKVSMRLRHHGDPAHPFTEAVGVIQSVEAGTDGAVLLRLLTRRGGVRTAVTADILAAKVF